MPQTVTHQTNNRAVHDPQSRSRDLLIKSPTPRPGPNHDTAKPPRLDVNQTPQRYAAITRMAEYFKAVCI